MKYIREANKLYYNARKRSKYPLDQEEYGQLDTYKEMIVAERLAIY